jgi:hypothetical protein
MPMLDETSDPPARKNCISSLGFYVQDLRIDGWISLFHLPGEQNPDRGVEGMSPMLQRASVKWPWSGMSLACFFVFGSLAVAAMIEGAWLRHDTFFERRVFGKNHFILAAFLGKGSVVMVFMVMLVLSLKCWVSMLSRVYRDIVGLGLLLSHGVGNGRLKSPFLMLRGDRVLLNVLGNPPR